MLNFKSVEFDGFRIDLRYLKLMKVEFFCEN